MASREVTSATLTRFRESLVEQGLSEGTVACYSLLVARCARDGVASGQGIMGRLLSGDLAPKSLRQNRAALMAWATFVDDASLAMKLKRMRLPPPERVKPKIQITADAWKGLVQAIRSSNEPPLMRAILLLLATRGFRVGDVMRIRRQDVVTALRVGRLSLTTKGRKRFECDVTHLRPSLEELASHHGWAAVDDLVVSRRCRSTGYKKRQIAARGVRRALARVIRKAVVGAGADVAMERTKPHDLRRMYALSFLKRLDHDPQALQKLTLHMGWSDIAIAALYADEVNRAELDQVGKDLASDLIG